MESLIKYFSVNTEKASGRIIEVGVSVCKLRPWSMCDMFQFGFTSDMDMFWSLTLDPRSRGLAKYAENKYKVRDIVTENVAEIRLHRKYVKINDFCYSIDPEDYYKVLKDLFIILDKEMVDLYWYKYSAEECGWAGHPFYSENQLFSRISFSDWYLIYKKS